MIAMICLLAQTPSTVCEVVDPSANEISLAAVVRVPKLGGRDIQLLQVITRVLNRGTEEYGRREMTAITNGRPVRASLMPDSVVIRTGAEKTDLKAALSLMNSLLRRASFTQKDVDAAVVLLGRRDPSYWSVALRPVGFDLGKVRREEVVELYTRLFRPEATTIAIGGPFSAGDAEADWSARTDDWKGTPPPRFPDDSASRTLTTNPTGVTSLELRSAEFPGPDAELPTRLLALFAFGVGKSSSLYQILRERHGWSYRQEAMLAPTRDGWQPKLLWVQGNSSDAAKRIEILRGELVEDVRQWTDAQRTRALAMAEAVFERGLEFSPLTVADELPGRTLAQRTLFAAYWRMKTNSDWDSNRLLSAMKLVSLADLKETAIQIVSTGTPFVLPGG